MPPNDELTTSIFFRFGLFGTNHVWNQNFAGNSGFGLKHLYRAPLEFGGWFARSICVAIYDALVRHRCRCDRVSSETRYREQCTRELTKPLMPWPWPLQAASEISGEEQREVHALQTITARIQPTTIPPMTDIKSTREREEKGREID